MGICWKTMTLLSTLAALVIIVNSAEEDFEPDYRDVRPRRYDTATTTYEQPWRTLDMEPVARQSTEAEWPISSQDEPPRRRRQGRKRKRRPQPISEEDLVTQERIPYQEEYRPYQSENLNDQSGIIRRRRKQFDVRPSERPNYWIQDTVDADRPLVRKRGHKRKRPVLEDTRSELSEMNAYTPNDNTAEDIENPYTQPTETMIYEANHNYDNSKERQFNMQHGDTVTKNYDIEPSKYNTYDIDNYKIDYKATESTSSPNDKREDDRSLSEFSLEIQPSSGDISAHGKMSEKVVITQNDLEKAKSNETLDPQILKQMLKKSNGRSLSEILQQHNLSLVDLLRGKEKAISILMEDTPRNDSKILLEQLKYSKNETNEENTENTRGKNYVKRTRNRNMEPKPKASVRDIVVVKNLATEYAVTSSEKSDNLESRSEYVTTKAYRFTETEKLNSTEKSSDQISNIEPNTETSETTTKSYLRRRYPIGARKKLRMRPMNNTTYKSQLSRDLIALTSRRYQVNKNISRSREWKDIMPTQVKIPRKDEPPQSKDKNLSHQIITTTIIAEELTTSQSLEDINIVMSTLPPSTETEPSTINEQTDNTENIILSTESTQASTISEYTVVDNTPTTVTTFPTALTTTSTTTTTERPLERSASRPLIKVSDLRRQAFNNRLKRKRLKQKNTTTESSQQNSMKDIFGMANLVSASEFIAKVQPRTTSNAEDQDFTTLEDFITTEVPVKPQIKHKQGKISKNKYFTIHTLPVQDKEESAKIEIEEILNDTLTSARLSKILMERNMTINELVEHRERGSSHIHLADIFHNASREPNPPEPFLSKSLIEPISKETYPLRALLEANLHDPTAKATSIEPNTTYSNNINIPVVMDFGNNVNENGENMGIMSLFNNFTAILKGQVVENNTQALYDDGNHKYGKSRDSRILNIDKDLISWKDIIAIMHRGQNKSEVVEQTTKEISPQIIKKIALDNDMDSDDDSLIMVNDLNHLSETDNHNIVSTSEENFKNNLQEITEPPVIHGVLNKSSDSAKSVTVATASIIGLAIVLFLIIYVTFRWKQQRTLFNEKQTLRRDRIPTPVFENRKSHKINSSTRSKSPMISSSNIYSIDTLETRNGNDSPEYMWDSLRKPFQ